MVRGPAVGTGASFEEAGTRAPATTVTTNRPTRKWFTGTLRAMSFSSPQSPARGKAADPHGREGNIDAGGPRKGGGAAPSNVGSSGPADGASPPSGPVLKKLNVERQEQHPYFGHQVHKKPGKSAETNLANNRRADRHATDAAKGSHLHASLFNEMYIDSGVRSKIQALAQATLERGEIRRPRQRRVADQAKLAKLQADQSH
jgi:hypothetical protein